MKALRNKFWTSRDEMLEEIEAMGFEVADADDEYVVFFDDEDEEYTMRVLQAGSTITLI